MRVNRLLDLGGLTVYLSGNRIVSFGFVLTVFDASQDEKTDDADEDHEDEACQDFEEMFVYHVASILPRRTQNKKHLFQGVFCEKNLLFLNENSSDILLLVAVYEKRT